MKKRRLLCLLAALAMTVQLVCLPAQAAEAETTAPPQTTAPAVNLPQMTGTDASVTNGCHSLDAQNPLLGSSDRVDYSQAAVLYEVQSDTLMYAWNPDAKMYPASLVKIMTALLALEMGNLQSPVTVSPGAIQGIPEDAMSVELVAGEILTLDQLMYCLLVASANDAAAVIAEHIAGSQEAFVALMNKRATELGCTGTNFVNAHGLNATEQYTTARDAAKILRAALQQEHFMTYFGTTTYTMEATNKHEERNFTTTNYMMLDNKAEYDYRVTGGRTGANSSTDRVFAATAEKNGLVYLTVIMGADSDYEEDGYSIKTNGGFHDTKELLDMGFDGYTVTQVLHGGQAIAQYSVMNGENAVVAGVDQSCTTILPQGITAEDLIFRYAATDLQLNAPVEQGQRLTYVQVWYGSVCVGQSSISALNRVAVAQAADDPGDGDEGGGLQFGLTILGVLLAIIGGVVVINFVIKTVRLSMLRSRAKKRRRNRRRSR